MNYLRKQSAVERYNTLKTAGATKEEIADALSADEKDYSNEEQVEIMSSVFEGSSLTNIPGSIGENKAHELEEVERFNAEEIPEHITISLAAEMANKAVSTIDNLPDTAENLPLRQELIKSVEKLNSYINKKSSRNQVSADKSKNPNDSLDLSGIDYRNLRGEVFKKYVELVGDRSYKFLDDGEEKEVRGKLLENDHYVFELYKVKPIRRPRYVGVEGTPVDYVGLEITSDKPIHTTSISVKMALELNSQILNAHSIAGHGRYYLLKK